MAIFNTLIFIGSFFFIIALIIYNLRSKHQTTYRLNPITIILSGFMIMGLWLTDVLTLNMGDLGLSAMSGVTANIQTPSLLLYIITIAGMSAVVYYYYKTISKTKESARKAFNFVMVWTLGIGIALAAITAVAMANVGFQGIVLGFNALGLYHTAIPMILIPTLVLMVNDF